VHALAFVIWFIKWFIKKSGVGFLLVVVVSL